MRIMASIYFIYNKWQHLLPTPVSALLHAATMVTAGVYLLMRASPVFEYSDTVLAIVTLVGCTTALFAASIALVHNDIKKVITYSTIFFFNDTATAEIYTLSLHDALPIFTVKSGGFMCWTG